MRFLRLKWQNDKPATEKQIDYVSSLLRQKKADLPALTTLKEMADIAFWNFWNAAEIPFDLTFKEATSLIDEIRGLSYWNATWTIDEIASVVLRRIEGGTINTGVRNIMISSVFAPNAIQFIINLIQTMEPELYEKAMFVRNERKAVKA